MHWLSPFLYMAAKYGPSDKFIKRHWHRWRWNFSNE